MSAKAEVPDDRLARIADEPGFATYREVAVLAREALAGREEVHDLRGQLNACKLVLEVVRQSARAGEFAPPADVLGMVEERITAMQRMEEQAS